MAHTPGPWTASTDGASGIYWVEKDASEHCSSIADVFGRDDHPEYGAMECHDNAMLIAAAPDLLEACKQGLELSSYAAAINFDSRRRNTQEFLDELHQRIDRYQQLVMNAIAKAEGNNA